MLLSLLLMSAQLFSFAHSFLQEMTYEKGQTTFQLFAPSDLPTPPVVRIYQGTHYSPLTTHCSLKKMRLVDKDLWQVKVEGDLMGACYTFDAGHGETPGVFARAVSLGGKRAAIIDMERTNPEGWAGDVRPPLASDADLIIYEAHQRDFSIHPSSGLHHKGKYLAFTEPKALAHLKALGINAVHFQPLFDYASVDESRPDSAQYNWGYDPLNYNVPEGSYSTDAANPATRIREFKQMVMALHKAGIRVIFDAVYNHTMDIEGSNFQRTYPDYFFRRNAEGTYSNGSGCGNETASERPMMRQYMIESVLYWINEYHIDGFRFDLMGVHDIETMNAIRAAVDKIDPSITLYGEGWAASAPAYPAEKLAMKANMKQLPRIAAFSDDFRDALRGPFSDDTKGAFLAGIPGSEESIKFGIAGCIAHPQVNPAKVNYSKEPWANEPSQMISYVSCHDDMCLRDRLTASIPGATLDEIVRLDLLAQTAVFTSQGIPFMLAGEELFRTKQGVHNSYCSPDSINHLDWNNLDRYPEIFRYYAALCKLRRDHPAFRLGSAEAVRKHLEFLTADNCLVAFRLKDLVGIDPARSIVVVLNARKETAQVAIPAANYHLEVGQGSVASDGTLTVPAQCAAVFMN